MTRNPIDWDLARSRLRASETALQEALTESPERIRIAYRERAIRLATLQIAPGPVRAPMPVLVFRLSGERYAIELAELAEVAALSNYTPVPGSPPEFPGVVNLRGEVRAVLDLGRLLGISDSGKTDTGFLLLLRRQGRKIGLRVDAIEELTQVQPEQLRPAVDGKYAKGVIRGTTALLSVDALTARGFSNNGPLKVREQA